MDIANLQQKLVNNQWMIIPSYHATLSAAVEVMMNNVNNDGKCMIDKIEHDLDKPFDDTIKELQKESGPVTAIIEVNGILMKHPSTIDLMMGAMDVDDIRHALHNAIEDENVEEICLYVNSPGGITTGIEELGRYIQKCSEVKPVYGFTDSMACSAAYWLMACCDSIIATPTAIVGNVGVFSLVLDETKKNEMEGLKVDAFISGKFKGMGHPFHSLTDEEKRHLQKEVDDQHIKFKNIILTNRPEVPESAMEGISYEGQEAMDLHLIDAMVDSLDELLDEIQETSDEKQNSKSITMKNETKSMESPVVESLMSNASQVNEATKIPGLPGVNESEAPVEPDDEGEECTCDKCGSSYKSKKKAKHDEPDADDAGGESDDDEDDKEEKKSAKKSATHDILPTVVPKTPPTISINATQKCADEWRESINSVYLIAGISKKPEGLSEWQKAMLEFQNQQ